MKKHFPFLFLLLASRFLFGQTPNDITITFNHVALSVQDLDQSVAFYRDVLNLAEITNRTQKEGIRWFSLGEDKELHLISTLKHEKVVLNKAVHFALTTADFDGLVARLESMDIVYSDWPGNLNNISIRADGIKQIYIQDPDGNWIEVNSVGQQD